MTYRVFVDNDETLRIRGAGHLLGATPDAIEKACRMTSRESLLDALRQRWEPQWVPDDPRWQQAREDVLFLLAELRRIVESGPPEQWPALPCEAPKGCGLFDALRCVVCGHVSLMRAEDLARALESEGDRASAVGIRQLIDHCGRTSDNKPGCDVTEGEWGCILDREHDGPHRNAEGLCIGPMVACFVPPGQTMYEVVWEWLRENNPAALELCPYKVLR